MNEIYLDHAAGTPVRPEVAAAMAAAASEHFANPSSVHLAGQRARRAVETARERVAAALGAPPGTIVFTAGATEAINQALAGLAPGGRIITSPLEHRAVLAAAERERLAGREVVLVDARSGEVTAEAVRAAAPAAGDLLAFMLVNNETGAFTDVARITRLAAKRGALTFCDATQAFGAEAVDVRELHVAALCLSGHKCGGPRGVGVLYVQEGVPVAPLLVGGEQERGLRAGTGNLPAIVGMGVAAEIIMSEREALAAHLESLRAVFEAQLSGIPGLQLNARELPRGVKHSSVTVAGVDGQSLLMALDALGVAVSAGSACAAGSIEPSHVLLAMGLGEAEARATLRVSFGWTTTAAEVAEAAVRLGRAVEMCRSVEAT